MKRLIIPFLSLLALPSAIQANIDPKVAEMCMKATDFEGCVKSMSGQTNKKSSPVSSKYDEALILFEAGDTASAMKKINSYIEANNSSKEAYLARGIIYSYDLMENEKAMEDFNKAIEIDDQYSIAYALRADHLYWELGNASQAKKDIEKAYQLSPEDTYVNLARGNILLDYAYVLLDKKKLDLAISNAKDSVTNFEKVILDKNPEKNLIIKRLFPLGITYEAHALLGDANFDVLYTAHKENGDRIGAKQFLKDSINHYTNAIAIAPSQEESEKYEIERDFDMITLAELHLYRGNAYSWITKDWKKACKDWKVSRKLGNKEAGVNARQWKC